MTHSRSLAPGRDASEGTRTFGRPLPLLLATCLALLPLACGGGQTASQGVVPPPVTVSAKLVPVRDCADLDAWLVDVGVERFVHLWEVGGYGMPMPLPGPGGPPNSGAEDGAGAADDRQAPSDYTTTNVQEAGVDEVDVLKTNGETIFYLQDAVLHVLDAWPADEAREIARVELDGWGGGIFLVGDRLVVFTSIFEGGYGPLEPGLPPPFPPMGGEGRENEGAASETIPVGELPEGEWDEPFTATRVTIFDVADPAAPEVVSTFDIEGSLVGARLVDGRIYVAAIHAPSFCDPELLKALEALDLPDPWNLDEREREEAAAEVRVRVRPVISDYVARAGRARFLPDVRAGDGTRTDLLDCTDLYRPERAADLAVFSVVAFDPTDDAPPTGVGVITNGWQLYASQEAIYVTQDSRWWWWSDGESRYAETHIHRIDLNDGAPAYRASGKVPGWVLNQFSMSEHEGALRVATTDRTWGDWWWGPMPGTGEVVRPPSDDAPMHFATAAEAPPRDANNVFVLEPRGTDLMLVGALRGIAPDEQICAVRFLDELGYVVTFEQVDPLFTVDLSDPTAPRILGELHITGFSTYLHPMDADHLIGIGREGTDTGMILGLQLQLFDVSDPAHPTRTHQEILGMGETGWSWSEAEHDHHAFTFYSSLNLLAIPVTLEDWGWMRDEYAHFSGIIVYHVSTEDGFAEMGRVSHTSLVREVECSPEQRLDPMTNDACDGYLYPWFAHMRRSLFIEDVLFAFSNVGVTVSTLDALDEPVVTIPLR